MTNRQKEVTAHIRKCLKREGIPARVRMFNTCGDQVIQVFTVAHDAFWTPEQVVMIAHIAKCNRLTGSRRSEINVELHKKLTMKQHFDFHYHSDLDVAQYA